jgi:hypothetical protein
MHHVPLPLSLPDRRQGGRTLVLCISRVFAFEKWQLFIAAMELYRELRVDLVVTHVYSAVKSVFDLMSLYQGTGTKQILNLYYKWFPLFDKCK